MFWSEWAQDSTTCAPNATPEHDMGPPKSQKALKVNIGVNRSKEIVLGRQSALKTAQNLFRGTPSQAERNEELGVLTQSTLRNSQGDATGHSANTGHRHACDTSSAAQSPLSTSAGGKDGGC